MSKYKHSWRPNVERIVRYYPELRDRKAELRKVSHSEDGVHTAATRTTENIALRLLSPREEEELYAVETAIEDIGRQRDGREILRIIELVDWSRRCNIAQAAFRLHMDRSTAARRRGRFLYAVARNLKYL